MPEIGREPGRGEALAEDRGVEDEAAVGRLEAIESGGDQGRQRLGDGERREISRWGVGPVVGCREPALGDQHSDRLDGIEGNALGACDDRPGSGLGQARNEPGQERAHGLLGERLEVEAREVAAPGAPIRAAIEELRTGQGQDVQRDRSAPLEQVIDEVERAGIRPVEILEDQDYRGGGGEALEKGSPGAEELLGTRACLDTEERQQRRLDPSALRLIRDVLGDHRGDLGSGRSLVVSLGEAGPTADHLAEGPERDPLAIRRRAAAMPPGQSDDPVQVLLEFPGEATLADPADPGDADEPSPALAGRRVVQILEEA